MISIGISLGYSFPFVAPCVFQYLSGTDPLEIACNLECVPYSAKVQVEEVFYSNNAL